MIFRISKKGVTTDNIHWNIICKNIHNELYISVVKTTKEFKIGQTIIIPDNLLKKINWKLFYPTPNFPHILPSSYEVKNLNLRLALNNEKLLFDQFGKTYYLHHKNSLLGFIYIKNFEILKHKKKILPKLHLSIACEAIESQILFNLFVKDSDDINITYTNSLINDVYDRKTKKIFQNEHLEICKLCKSGLTQNDSTIMEWIKLNELHKFIK